MEIFKNSTYQKMGKLANIKMHYCLSKDTIKRMKSQSTENIYIETIKDLVLKICEELLQINK